MIKILRFLFTARQNLLLAWRLLWDPKVPGALKLLLPVLAMIYWLSPIDLMPLLPFDDIVVVGLALKLFVELAQPISSEPAGDRSVHADLDADAIQTTWHVVEDDESEPETPG